MIKLKSLILISLLSLFGWCWDYRPGEFQRVGRLKIFLLSGFAYAAVHVSRSWHWSAALLYLYIGGVFLHYGMPAHGALEVFTLTTTLFLIPEIYKRVSKTLFENIILGTSLLHCVVGGVNLFGIFPLFKITRLEVESVPIGFLAQPTVLGPYLCFAMAISLHRFIETRKPLYGCIAVLNLIIAIATQSTMSFLSLSAVAFFFLLYYRQFLALIGCAILGGLAVLALNQYFADLNFSSFSGRTEPWRDAYYMWKQSPVFGYGIGSWSQSAVQIAKIRGYSGIWYQVHNEYLQVLFELGAAGMTLVSIFFLKILTRCHVVYLFRNRNLYPYVAGILLFCVNSMGNHPLHLVPHGPLFAYCLYAVLKYDHRSISQH